MIGARPSLETWYREDSVAWNSSSSNGFALPAAGPLEASKIIRLHSEAVPLGDTEEGRALAWRDFRSYCAGREASGQLLSNLTAYGTAGRT